MFFFLPILAQDDSSLGKVIIGIIVVIFWIVSAIAQALGKRQQKQRKKGGLKHRQAELEAELREREARLRDQGDIPRPPPWQMPPIPQPPRLPPKPKRAPKPAERKKSQGPRDVLAPAEALREISSAVQSRAAAREVSALSTQPRSRLLVHHIRGNLSHNALRRQIVMMEILQPPLALRDDR